MSRTPLQPHRSGFHKDTSRLQGRNSKEAAVFYEQSEDGLLLEGDCRLCLINKNPTVHLASHTFAILAIEYGTPMILLPTSSGTNMNRHYTEISDARISRKIQKTGGNIKGLVQANDRAARTGMDTCSPVFIRIYFRLNSPSAPRKATRRQVRWFLRLGIARRQLSGFLKLVLQSGLNSIQGGAKEIARFSHNQESRNAGANLL